MKAVFGGGLSVRSDIPTFVLGLVLLGIAAVATKTFGVWFDFGVLVSFAIFVLVYVIQVGVLRLLLDLLDRRSKRRWCPSCGKLLASNLAQRCPHCGADWFTGRVRQRVT
jgi:hypothetical protein